MFDLEKAFDNTDHKILVETLERTDISQRSLNIIKLLLNNFRYSISGKNFVQCTVGTPQGSSISPLLFIIYINGISNIIERVLKFKGLARMFADDLLVRAYTELKVYEAIEAVQKHMKSLGLKLNHKKCKIIRI